MSWSRSNCHIARVRHRLAANGKLSICIVMLLVVGVAMYQLALDLRAGCLGPRCSSVKHNVELHDTAYNSNPSLGLIDHDLKDIEHYHAADLQSDRAFGNISPEVPRSHLETRQAPWDDDYKKATKKGEKFICWMKDPASAGSKAIPKFTKYSDIEAQGWTRKQETVDYTHVTDGAYKSMIEIIGTDLSNGIKVRFDHDRDVGNYPATNGEYVNVYQTTTTDQNTKSHRAKHLATLGKTPGANLSPSSPSVNGLISSPSNTNTLLPPPPPSPLRYIFRRNIQNKKTQEIINKALTKTKKGINGKAKPWGGDVFKPGDEGFEALLGTPNTSGICWMLIQHAEWWGKKEVKSIRVWWDGKGAYYTPSLMVEVGDVEE
ncbi:hypothetical protein HII31_04683 [Pseudocercospora fuligena]|uniref:Uncharacterized protein n=1 Tax=Pseudocercospora fuligena TaxID=685502 RepID=A0A8H6RPQ4_9PEZI|nr:hypothetical protein HII31_04683 [Pseudocercospora fuligena]